MEAEQKKEEDDCPFEHVLSQETNENGETMYYVKYYGKKYADSKWLPKADVEAYQYGRTLINRYLRQRNPNQKGLYDSQYDKIEQIILQEGDKYLVAWCGLGYDDLTWETQVTSTALKNFNRRKAMKYPLRNQKFDTLPEKIPTESYMISDLTPREVTTFNNLIRAFLEGYDYVVKDTLNYSPVKSCAAFIKTLMLTGHSCGPILIVSNELDMWSHAIGKSDLTCVKYQGSQSTREKLNELFLQPNDTEYLRFHILLTEADNIYADANDLMGINYQIALFHSQQGKQYMNLSDFTIARRFCVLPAQSLKSAIKLDKIVSLCHEKDIKQAFTDSEIRAISDRNSILQPVLQRIQKHGDGTIKSPDIYSIHCPLTEAQISMFHETIREYRKKDNLRIATYKAMRIISHPFLVHKGEYLLNFADPITVSSKMQVLAQILHDNNDCGQTTLIITHYSQIIDIIMDYVNYKGYEFHNFSNVYAPTLNSNEEKRVLLYNPNFEKATISLESVHCVVIFDGPPTHWKELFYRHKKSRNPSISISKVYILENRLCDERGLISLFETDFNEKKAEPLLRTATIQALNRPIQFDPYYLIESAVLYTDPLPQIVSITQELPKGDFWTSFKLDSLPPPNDEKIPDKPHKWTVIERNKLVRGLFTLGYGRWDAIRKVCGLNISGAQMDQYSKTLLYLMIKFVNAANGFQTARGLIGNLTEEESHPLIKMYEKSTVFNDDDFMAFFRRNSGPLIKQVEFLFYLQSCLGTGEIISSKIPQFKIGGGNPTEWWTEYYDKLLGYSTYVFGLGQYDHLIEFCDDVVCCYYLNMVGQINSRRLEERALKVCEVSKRILQPDEAIVDSIVARSSLLSPKIRKEIVSHVLKFGIPDTDDGEFDYDLFIEEAELEDEDKDQVVQLLEDVIDQCDHPSTENGINYNTALRIIQRITAMNQLRLLLHDRTDEQCIQFLYNAPKWRNLPKKWTPEIELEYFKLLREKGFGSLSSIMEDDRFLSVFESGQPPSFLTADDAACKRLHVLHDIYLHPPKPKEVKSAPSRKRAPSAASTAPLKKIIVPSLNQLRNSEIEYPLQISQANTLLNIGTIVSDREGFHTERYIYPAGFKSTRFFASLNDIDDRVLWISEIVDTGKKAPVFRVYQEDDPKKVYEGETSSSPWVQVLKAVSQIKGEKKANTISGPDAFQLNNPIVIYLIQNLPNAHDCKRYRFKPIAGLDDDD